MENIHEPYIRLYNFSGVLRGYYPFSRIGGVRGIRGSIARSGGVDTRGDHPISQVITRFPGLITRFGLSSGRGWYPFLIGRRSGKCQKQHGNT